MKISTILPICLFVVCVGTLQLSLQNQQTCLQFEVQMEYSSKVVNFHYNHNIGEVNLIIYKLNSREILQETGFGIDYKHTLSLTFNNTGIYDMCFQKKQVQFIDITFQIIDEIDTSNFAGKEQLAKTSRRISEFLMDIRRMGFNFKGVLEQHNERKQKILNQQDFFGFLMFIKLVAMIVIIGLQVFAVKKIFD